MHFCVNSMILHYSQYSTLAHYTLQSKNLLQPPAGSTNMQHSVNAAPAVFEEHIKSFLTVTRDYHLSRNCCLIIRMDQCCLVMCLMREKSQAVLLQTKLENFRSRMARCFQDKGFITCCILYAQLSDGPSSIKSFPSSLLRGFQSALASLTLAEKEKPSPCWLHGSALFSSIIHIMVKAQTHTVSAKQHQQS